MLAWQLEEDVFHKEGVRIIIRAKNSDPFGDYNYQRRAVGTSSITEWLNQRIYPLLNGSEVAVVDGYGRVVHGRTHVQTVRDSYAV